MATTSRSLGPRALRSLWSKIAAESLGTQARSVFPAAQTRRLHVLSSGNSSATALPASQLSRPRNRGKPTVIIGKGGECIAQKLSTRRYVTSAYRNCNFTRLLRRYGVRSTRQHLLLSVHTLQAAAGLMVPLETANRKTSRAEFSHASPRLTPHPTPQLRGSPRLEVFSSRRSRRPTRTPSSSCPADLCCPRTMGQGCTSPPETERKGGLTHHSVGVTAVSFGCRGTSGREKVHGCRPPPTT